MKIHKPILLVSIGLLLGTYNFNNYTLNSDEYVTVCASLGIGHSDNTSWNAKCEVPKSTFFTQVDFKNKKTIENVLEYTANDNGNMVSYNLLLFFLFKFFDYSDFMARLPSLISYLLTAAFIYMICKRFEGSLKLAQLATLIFLMNPMVMQYCRLARSYEFATLLGVMSTYILLYAINTQQSLKLKTHLLYGSLMATSFLAHFFTIYIFAAHCVFAFFLMNRKVYKLMFSGISCISILFYIWYINGGESGLSNMAALDHFILENTSNQTKTSVISLVEGLICNLNSVGGYYFQFFGYRNSEFFFLIILIITIILLTIYPFKQIKQHLSTKRPLLLISWLVLISCIALMTVAAIKSGHTTSFHARYGMFMSPFLSILFAFGFLKLLDSSIGLKRYIGFILLTIHLGLNISCFNTPLYGYCFTYYDVNGNVEVARKNPLGKSKYKPIADEIISVYSYGDTVVFDSKTTACYTNMYLIKHEKPIIQTIDEKINTPFVIQ